MPLSSGDYNQDGIVDLAVGAPDFYDPINANGNFYSFVDAIFYEELLTVPEMQGYGSKVYIFDGTNISSGGTFDSSQSAGSIFSEDSDALGTTLSTCDMNENGRDDLWLASSIV